MEIKFRAVSRKHSVKMDRTLKSFVKILERFKVVPQRACQTGNRTSKKLKGMVPVSQELNVEEDLGSQTVP